VIIWLLSINTSAFIKHAYVTLKSQPKIHLTPDKQIELTKYGGKKIREAKKLGNRYSPEMYFRDLNDIWKKYGCVTDYNISVLQSYMHQNIQSMPNGAKILEKAKNKYRARLDKLTGIDSKPKPVPKKKQIAFLMGFLQTYLLTILFSIPIFLLRMIEKEGILKTFFANKKDFFLAPILFWQYIWQYPEFIFREIDVEAEMRRIKGKYFSRLTKAERKQVKEIASSKEKYQEWKKTCTSRFALAYVFSFLVTIIFSLATPPVFSSNTSFKKAVIHQQYQRAGPIAEYNEANHDTGDQDLKQFCFPVAYKEKKTFFEASLLQDTKFTIPKGAVMSIDHVPLLARLVCHLYEKSNLKAKGDKHENVDCTDSIFRSYMPSACSKSG